MIKKALLLTATLFFTTTALSVDWFSAGNVSPEFKTELREKMSNLTPAQKENFKKRLRSLSLQQQKNLKSEVKNWRKAKSITRQPIQMSEEQRAQKMKRMKKRKMGKSTVVDNL